MGSVTSTIAGTLAVTTAAFDCEGAAFVASIVATLVAEVPLAVPGGKWTVIEICAVAPAGRGENSVNTADPVAAV